MRLPDKVGRWTLREAPQRIEPAGIFDYMDGAGELYLAYRLKQIDVYRYSADDNTEILAEIYQVESSDDAYGLLSLDWGGEPVDLTSGDALKGQPAALYGAGLLRLRSQDVYARVMAESETPETRAAVLELGKAIASGRPNGTKPALLGALPAKVGDYQLVNERLAFLRSHLVLNSIYFLSPQNILKLDARCEAVSASYRGGSEAESRTVRLIEIRYPGHDEALAAIRSFESAYLPEKPQATKRKPDAPSYSPSLAFLVEDGWMSYSRVGRTLILVFECHDEAVAWLMVDRASESYKTWEKNHD